MNLSIVVTTYDRQDDLADCLMSIDRQFDPPSEVVVVDDGDVEATRDRIESAGVDNVEHIEGESEGLPAARNAGIEAAAGDVVAFVDDDVILPPNWSRELRRTYERFPDIAGVGGYVLNYNPPEINKANVDSFGYRVLQGVRMALLYGEVGNVSPVGILWAPHVFMTSDVRYVDALQGCNMAFREDVLEEFQFDEWYGTAGSSACEELDFCARVSNDGNDLVYNPRLVALHKRSLDAGDDMRSGDPNYGNTTNLTHFIMTHPNTGPANATMFVLAMLVYALAKRDLGHLEAVKEGVLASRRTGTNASVRADGGDTHDE